MSKYTFGPVFSRRFGLSLGIDLSPEEKSCNFDCIYCELKSAKPIDTIVNPPKVEDIVKEVEQELEKESDIDVVTITSNGEPTLYYELDTLVDQLNKIKKDKKLLILSNASTIDNIKIQEVLKKIDIVKLSLDCPTPLCFKKIDRPLKKIKIENIISGIESFRKIYDKILVIEILIVKGINDNELEMKALNNVLQKIQPDRIDLGTIDRPPAYNVEPVDLEELKELSKDFENLPISIIHKKEADKKIDFLHKDIISLLQRRPQSEMDIKYLFSDNAQKSLDRLIKKNIVIKKDIAGVRFYILNDK